MKTLFSQLFKRGILLCLGLASAFCAYAGTRVSKVTRGDNVLYLVGEPEDFYSTCDGSDKCETVNYCLTTLKNNFVDKEIKRANFDLKNTVFMPTVLRKIQQYYSDNGYKRLNVNKLPDLNNSGQKGFEMVLISAEKIDGNFMLSIGTEETDKHVTIATFINKQFGNDQSANKKILNNIFSKVKDFFKREAKEGIYSNRDQFLKKDFIYVLHMREFYRKCFEDVFRENGANVETIECKDGQSQKEFEQDLSKLFPEKDKQKKENNVIEKNQGQNDTSVAHISWYEKWKNVIFGCIIGGAAFSSAAYFVYTQYLKG